MTGNNDKLYYIYMSILIDSHAHIMDAAFDADRDAVIKNSFNLGVKKIVEIACEAAEWQPALDLCAKYPGSIYAVLGLHPLYAAEVGEADFALLKTLFNQSAAVGIGEMGLDYFYEPFDKEKQKYVFANLLKMTAEIKLPAVLHIRGDKSGGFEAYEDTFKCLETHWTPKSKTANGVLHCFSGRYQDAARAVDMGLVIGINGIISYKKNDDLRASIKKIGLKNLILETDCPYLPPQSKRGKRNSPENIPEIAEAVADILGVSAGEVSSVTTANTEELFGI